MVLNSRLAEWRRGGAVPGTLLVRTDRFAEVSARHGQEAGALLVQEATTTLMGVLRETDLVGQYDDHTLVFLLPGADMAGILRAADRLRRAVERTTVPTQYGPMVLTVSVGGATAIASDDSAGLLRRTEEALDAASRSGGNCCYFHNGQWSETMAAALERAEAAQNA